MVFLESFTEMERSTSDVGSPVPWTGVLGQIESRKPSGWQHSFLSASDYNMPPIPATSQNPPSVTTLALPWWATAFKL